MKKVCLALKGRKQQWSFAVYESAEAAFYLGADTVDTKDVADDDYSHVVTLKRGELLIVEWMGAEYIYDDEEKTMSDPSKASMKHNKFGCVRFIKLPALVQEQQVKELIYMYAEAHQGWISASSLLFNPEHTHEHLRLLKNNDELLSKIDFSNIFKDKDEKTEEVKSSLLN